MQRQLCHWTRSSPIVAYCIVPRISPRVKDLPGIATCATELAASVSQQTVSCLQSVLSTALSIAAIPVNPSVGRSRVLWAPSPHPYDYSVVSSHTPSLLGGRLMKGIIYSTNYNCSTVSWYLPCFVQLSFSAANGRSLVLPIVRSS